MISEFDRSRIEASRQSRYENESDSEDEDMDDFDRKLARWEADRESRAIGEDQ